MTPSRLCLLMLAGLLAGCGAADYEAEMKKAQQRWERYEKEKDILGGPISLPAPKMVEGTPEAGIQVFLRLPAHLNPAAPAEARGGVFYDYLPSRQGPFGWVSLVTAKPDEKEFGNNLIKWFSVVGEVKRGPYTTKPDGRPGMSFTRTTFQDAAYSYSLNVHQGTQQQLAILYAVPIANVAQAARQIDMSLDTVGFEAQIAAARTAFRPGGPLDFVPR